MTSVGQRFGVVPDSIECLLERGPKPGLIGPREHHDRIVATRRAIDVKVHDDAVIHSEDRRIKGRLVRADLQPGCRRPRSEQFDGGAAPGDDGFTDVLFFASKGQARTVRVADEQSHADTTPRRFNKGVDEAVEGVEQERRGKHQDVDGMLRVGEMLLPNADRHLCTSWSTPSA